MTALAIRFHRRFYRPWIAPFGMWVCFSLFCLINALQAL